MPLNPERTKRLEEQVEKTLQGRTPLQEVPFYLCIYNPRDELSALDYFTQLRLRLEQKGFSAEIILLSQLMIEILEEEGYLKPEVLEKENEIREELEQDLRGVLSKGIEEKLLERLGQQPRGHCSILLRYGALWPFVHLSYLLQGITGSVKCTLVIPYPSSIGEGYPLDEPSEDTIPYYRAEKVDLR